MAQFYKISEFAKLIGVSAATLRVWEKRGLLQPHHISPYGYRYYTDEQLKEYFHQYRKNASPLEE